MDRMVGRTVSAVSTTGTFTESCVEIRLPPVKKEKRKKKKKKTHQQRHMKIREES